MVLRLIRGAITQRCANVGATNKFATPALYQRCVASFANQVLLLRRQKFLSTVGAALMALEPGLM